VLVAIGWLYQRILFPRQAAPPAAPSAPVPPATPVPDIPAAPAGS